MKNRKRGFTLVEIVVVLVILGILLAIAVPNVAAYIDRADAVACAANRRSLELEAVADYVSGDEASCAEAFAALNDGKRYTCPRGGVFTWEDAADSGTVKCSVHDAGTGAGPGGDPGPEDPSDPSGGGLIIKDGDGNSYVLHDSRSWSDILEKIRTESGEWLSDGTVLSDGTGTYCIKTGGLFVQRAADDMTPAELIANHRDKFIKLDGDKIIHTDAEISGGRWAVAPSPGDICLYRGKYYIATNNVGIWDIPPGSYTELLQ